MATILGLERAAVEITCLDASKNGIVSPANYNSPGQIVIAGERKAVERAMKMAGYAKVLNVEEQKSRGGNARLS
jgi:[acyl-carrier-protein] S-malonyltransferase